MASPGGYWNMYIPSGQTSLAMLYPDAQRNFDGWIGVKPNDTQIRGVWKSDPAQSSIGTVIFYTYLLYPDTTLPGEAYATNLYVDQVIMSGMFTAATLDQIIDITFHRPIPPAQGWTATYNGVIIG